MTTELRQITDHKVHLNDELSIYATDERGPDGSHHRYDISGYNPRENPSATFEDVESHDGGGMSILFQNGPQGEGGVNGITMEVLMAICIDRLRAFQAGQYACEENAKALTHLEAAIASLHARTRDRMARNVESQSKA